MPTLSFFCGIRIVMFWREHPPAHCHAVAGSKVARIEIAAKAFMDEHWVAWPGQLDLAPDAMHDELVANGEWVLR
jgi:hypothetical protein